jgi:hypothetical protein
LKPSVNPCYRESTGRFFSRDPIEGRLCCGLSWNPYIYVKDNAVNAIDPTWRDDEAEYGFRTFQIEKSYLRPLYKEAEKFYYCAYTLAIYEFQHPNASPDELVLVYASCLASINFPWN